MQLGVAYSVLDLDTVGCPLLALLVWVSRIGSLGRGSVFGCPVSGGTGGEGLWVSRIGRSQIMEGEWSRLNESSYGEAGKGLPALPYRTGRGRWAATSEHES